MITYKFNDKTGYIETKITGEISVNQLIEYIISLSKDTTLPKVLKNFTDATDARFSSNVTPDDLHRIVEANKKSIAARNIIYDAFVVSGSFETALCYIQNTAKLMIFLLIFLPPKKLL